MLQRSHQDDVQLKLLISVQTRLLGSDAPDKADLEKRITQLAEQTRSDTNVSRYTGAVSETRHKHCCESRSDRVSAQTNPC